MKAALADCTAAVAAADERTALRAEVDRLRARNDKLVAALGECRYAFEMLPFAAAPLYERLRMRALDAIEGALS